MIQEQLNSNLTDKEIFELYKTCSINNVNIITIDKDFTTEIYITNNNKENSVDKNLQICMMNYINGNLDRKKIVSEKENYSIYYSFDEYLSIYYLEMYGNLDDGAYFLIRTPIDSISESVSVMNNFTGIAFVGYLILGIICITIFAIYISKSINRLCEISKKMSNLDFSEKYEDSVNKEIDILGDNFNNLSNSLENSLKELKEANCQLEKDIQEKIQIDDMRKEFISNVSHELKTPIALIQGYSEGLKECVNDEEKDFYCDVIIDESKTMNNLVKQLINLNQIEFGGEQLQIEQFDIVELTNGILQNFNLIIKDKNVSLKVNTKDSIIVSADEFRIEQIITNYITNALNHIDDLKTDKREIIIDTQEINDKIRFSVFNTGSYLAEEELDKIWIKFYKTDKARTREYGGSGIGLSIVAAIMNLYKEDYGVCNKDDGVEFWINLRK